MFYAETMEWSGYDLAQNNLTMEQSDHKADCSIRFELYNLKNFLCSIY